MIIKIEEGGELEVGKERFDLYDNWSRSWVCPTAQEYRQIAEACVKAAELQEKKK